MAKFISSPAIFAWSCGIVLYIRHSFIFININKGSLCIFLEFFLCIVFLYPNLCSINFRYHLHLPGSDFCLLDSLSTPCFVLIFFFLPYGLEVTWDWKLRLIHLFSSWRNHSPIQLFPFICWITAGEQVWNNLLWHDEDKSVQLAIIY